MKIQPYVQCKGPYCKASHFDKVVAHRLWRHLGKNAIRAGLEPVPRISMGHG